MLICEEKMPVGYSLETLSTTELRLDTRFVWLAREFDLSLSISGRTTVEIESSGWTTNILDSIDTFSCKLAFYTESLEKT